MTSKEYDQEMERQIYIVRAAYVFLVHPEY